MKIAICNPEKGFAPFWINYCELRAIPYKRVNPYDTNIVEQVRDCDIVMWHHHHGNPKDVLFAKQLLASIEASGKIVFPDHNTGWHFDDKVGEMYLLQALNLPLVKSYVFYDKKDALAWAYTTSFPKVFKLRGGAGSSNVKLVKNYSQAKRLISKSFGRGFKAFNPWNHLKEQMRRWRERKESFRSVINALGRLVISPDSSRLKIERDYVYFQDYMPDNSSDTRITIIGGEKALAFRRGVREGDFRASGSGNIFYGDIDLEMISIAFKTAKELKSQCIAIDFIYDEKSNPKIVEISYGFVNTLLDKCGGYWTSDLKWHEDPECNSCFYMMDYIISQAASKN